MPAALGAESRPLAILGGGCGMVGQQSNGGQDWTRQVFRDLELGLSAATWAAALTMG